MRYLLALLAAVNAWGSCHSSEECEPGLSLASLDNTYTAGSTYTVGSAQLRLGPDEKTALVKEEEFESAETIAAIEKNREDRERTVVMDR